MNDYCKGVIEALTWVLSRTEVAAVNSKKPIVKLQGEIEQLREEVLVSTAVDFPHRIRAL
jgi:hypothetical protein